MAMLTQTSAACPQNVIVGHSFLKAHFGPQNGAYKAKNRPIFRPFSY